MSYIGQSKYRLCLRFYVHKLNIRNQETNKTTMTKHCWENDHTFNFYSAKIICKPNSMFELDFLEAFTLILTFNNN